MFKRISTRNQLLPSLLHSNEAATRLISHCYFITIASNKCVLSAIIAHIETQLDKESFSQLAFAKQFEFRPKNFAINLYRFKQLYSNQSDLLWVKKSCDGSFGIGIQVKIIYLFFVWF